MAARTEVLVTYASKMGSTQEIAEAIGSELETFGMPVTLAPCTEDVSPKEFEGVIIGSAIFTRRWVKAATNWERIRAWASDIARQLDPATAETQQQ
jgi:menaquinone-dependent protoporphyrinogen oxidase